MKSLNTYLTESSSITLAQIKKIVKGVKYDIEDYLGEIHIIFDDDDYWDWEEEDLKPKIKDIYNKLAKITNVARWDDRNWIIVQSEKPTIKPTNQSTQSKKETDIHKPQSNGLSLNDEDLIDLAQSTTYRSSILRYIDMVDTQKAKKILKNILSSNDVEWED